MRATLIRFDIEPIRWIEGRKTLQEIKHDGFSDFWRTVTFENYRIERAKKQACVKLEFESFEQLQAAMGQAIEGVNHWTGQLEALGQRRDVLIALIEEHGSLHGWVHFFEGNLLETLRNELITALAGSDLARLRKVLGTHQVGRLLSQVQGLQAKLAYLDDMIAYLTKERDDRRKRIASIDRTRKIWALKPHDSLTGDKTKWLVTVPEMKKKGIGKRLRWVRRIHRNVYEYDHWDDFDLYLLATDDFIPYDAFGYGADAPMPWEGFAREVIPDLDAFREQHDMEKKDYSMFKELGQQAQQGPSEEAGDGGSEGGGDEGAGVGEAAAAGAAAAVVAAELMDETAEVADQS